MIHINSLCMDCSASINSTETLLFFATNTDLDTIKDTKTCILLYRESHRWFQMFNSALESIINPMKFLLLAICLS